MQENTRSFAALFPKIMNQNRIQHTFLYMWLVCLFLLTPFAAQGANTETTFRITVLKTNGEPQPGMILKISSRSQEYTGDAQGVITFRYEIEDSYTRTAYLYFPADREKSVASFTLEAGNATKTFYLDSPQDIVAYKQSQQLFPIEGYVTTASGEPITGAVVSIQGTGRQVLTDEIGLFQIDADYNHPIRVRADGMENQSVSIQAFLQSPNEPYTIVMQRKNTGRVYASAEQMPEYPGGMKAFQQYLKRNLKYPPQAKRDSIEGVVVIQFIVERNGRIASPAIVRGLEASMDTAALNAIREMPRWIPAKDHGITVRCKYSVPVQFKIERPKPVQPKPLLTSKDSILHKDSLLADSLLTDSVARDSLRMKKLTPDSLRTDSLRLRPDSLRLLSDSIRMPDDSLRLKKDSLLAPADSLIAPKDSLAQTPDTHAEPQKPKKRNIFVRFFRWLFGIKDKPEQTPAEKPAEN